MSYHDDDRVPYLKVLLKLSLLRSSNVIVRPGTPVMGRFQQSRMRVYKRRV